MLDDLFKGLFETSAQSSISVTHFLICIAVALVAGVILALVYRVKSRYTKSFLMTLVLLPAVVCAVIMMVNGSIGAGVAVAGAFSLVRFRSAPGSAKDICMIFIAMGAGLMSGMGYIAYALLFTVVMGAICIIFKLTDAKASVSPMQLNIVVPETLNYKDMFEDIFEKYTESHYIVRIKTANMGSMFKLRWNVVMKKDSDEKEFIDELRCRNGNLEISLCELDENENSL